MNATSSPIACACPGSRPSPTARIYQQFARPTGLLGHVVGFVLAARNHKRGEWVISLLGLRPNDRVLEVGFGPGADVQRASRAASEGFVAGVDHSEVMVRQARRRNARAVAEKRVALQVAPATHIPYDDGSFDVVYSINCAQFWEDPAAALAEQRRVLRVGGTLAVAVQPRGAKADAAAAETTARYLMAAVQRAGFHDAQLHMLPQRPTPVACVVAVK